MDSYQNVYLTPHNASSSVHMFPRMIALIEENIGRYERNEASLHIVVPFPTTGGKIMRFHRLFMLT
ncbi:MAG: hypothetical protein MZU97_17310 [Bacillus subtilis]|nr:hypothetical protein [Bacillus subtilis]